MVCESARMDEHERERRISKTYTNHSFVLMQIDSALGTSHATSSTAPKLIMQCSAT